MVFWGSQMDREPLVHLQGRVQGVVIRVQSFLWAVASVFKDLRPRIMISMTIEHFIVL